jgi:hypothetical protein
MKKLNYLFFAFFMAMIAFSATVIAQVSGSPVHRDEPFLQDYSVKYYFSQPGVKLQKVASDRNGKIQVLSSAGLLHTHAGAFLYPGTLQTDGTYRPMADKNLRDCSLTTISWSTWMMWQYLAMRGQENCFPGTK